MFEIVKPAPFICIPILVPVEALAALVVPELPPKNIPVKKRELPLHLAVPVPIPFEDRTLAKIVGPFALPLPPLESAPVAILVDKLEGARPVGLVPAELARVHTAIAKYDPAPSLFLVCPVLPDV